MGETLEMALGMQVGFSLQTLLPYTYRQGRQSFVARQVYICRKQESALSFE